MSGVTRSRLKEFGIRPDTSLGQNFLVDDNILKVVDNLIDLNPNDVVIEPGAGVGVLTDHLARMVKAVHAIEVDQRLRPALESTCSVHPNVQIHWGDAVKLVGEKLDPVPNVMVANLPYHVAAPIVVTALLKNTQITRFCTMVQKEIADRFFAETGASDYSAVSVLLQICCQRTGIKKVPRTVFQPVPNIDSALIAFSRNTVEVNEATYAFIRTSFAHRRKTLANNLKAAKFSTEAIYEAFDKIGVERSARPQELSPLMWLELSRQFVSGGLAA